MNEIIAALQDEIAAAQKKLNEPGGIYTRQWLRGYIQGLQTAVALLEKEPARELPY